MGRIDDVQRKVLSLCEKTNELRYSVARVLEDVPQPEGENWDGMADDEIPPSLAFHLHVTLGYLEGELCKDACEALMEAAVTNPKRLRENWKMERERFEARYARELEEVRASSPS